MTETSHMPRRKQFAQRIRYLRRENSWTRKQLAWRLGVGETTIQRIESGERNLYFEEALMLSDIFQVSLEYLAGETNDATQN